jgi:hypothetical protein
MPFANTMNGASSSSPSGVVREKSAVTPCAFAGPATPSVIGEAAVSCVTATSSTGKRSAVPRRIGCHLSSGTSGGHWLSSSGVVPTWRVEPRSPLRWAYGIWQFSHGAGCLLPMVNE